METEELYQKCSTYLQILCNKIPSRCVGSEGNRMATSFFEKEISSFGWNTEMQEFEAIDWEDGGATLQSDSSSFDIFVSPYSLGCTVEGQIVSASCVEELAQIEIGGKIIFLYGEIAKEQLMPKNFVFYNPEEHQQIISLLEKGRPKAIICATGENPALAGGVYPFPLIEDGDYDGNRFIEIVAFNGEDYYAVPGQMLYIFNNQDRFNEILLNINIDGAGYKEGKSAFSFYGLPEEIEKNANGVLSKFNGITEGAQWPQGDHSIFTQNGCPAIAVSSQWFTENIDSQEIVHTPKDNIEIVDCQKVVEIAEALYLLIGK